MGEALEVRHTLFYYVQFSYVIVLYLFNIPFNGSYYDHLYSVVHTVWITV